MNGAFVYYVTGNLDTIFTGLTMAIIGISIYEARDGFFLSGGQFRGKYEALIIFSIALFGASLFTPVIAEIWADILPNFHPVQLIGLMAIMGMVAVNRITGWNYLDMKSISVYAVGCLLIVYPDILVG